MAAFTPEEWQQAEPLIDAALELPDDEQAAYLLQACPDPAFRARVEAMLAACRDTDPALDRPAPLMAAGLLAAELLAGRKELSGPVGLRIGPYRVLHEIGRGGMGTVYLAERADDQYRKRVALKLVRHLPGDGGEALRRRFLHERQILASLDHPHIARLLEGGMSDEGPYFVMEYVEGEPLTAYCDRRALPVEARLRLFCDVCAAVQYAHQNLVVHRDLKPTNILVTEADGGRPVVKLLDFGIAKLLDTGQEPGVAPLTETGLRLLTPEYASPEQIRGEAVTTASDVYTLGVLLYELLTGQRPYRFKGRSTAEMERMVLETEPEKPSTVVTRAPAGAAQAEGAARTRATAERLRRHLRGDLDTIVLMALRKEPARRYVSAQQLREDLERHLAGRPVLARKDTFTYRASKFVRRNRAGLVAAAVVAVLAVGFGAWHTVEVTRERDRARRAAAKAEQVSQFLADLFGAADPRQARGDTLTAHELLEQGVARIDSTLRDQPDVQAKMLSVIGGVYFYQGDLDAAEPLLHRARALLRRLGDTTSTEYAATLNVLGRLLRDRARLDEAEALHREAITLFRRHPGSAEDLATTLNYLSQVLFRRGDYEQSEPLLQEALAIYRARRGNEHQNVATTLMNLAGARRNRGDLAGTLPLLEEVLALYRKTLGPDHPYVPITLNNLALVLAGLERYDEAEPLLYEALGTYERVMGPDHPYVASTHHNLANIAFQRDDFTGALGFYRKALAIERSHYGDEHPDVADTYGRMAEAYRARGGLDSAAVLYRQALALRRRVLPDAGPEVARAMAELGDVLRAQGRAAEAEALLTGALARQRAAFAGPHRQAAATLVALGELYAARDPARAEPLLREALAMRRAAEAPPEALAEAGHALGACLTALGRYDEAEGLLREAHDRVAAGLGYRVRLQRRHAAERLAALYERRGQHARADSLRRRASG